MPSTAFAARAVLLCGVSGVLMKDLRLLLEEFGG